MKISEHKQCSLIFVLLTDYNFFINCGGGKVIIDGNEYEDDTIDSGASNYFPSDDGKWAYSSTGDFIDNERPHYVVANTTALNITKSELYMTARLSPLSLKYYAFCMYKGSYTIGLHFAEIEFTDDETYRSNGRRMFDVSIQVTCSIISPVNLESIHYPSNILND